MRRLSILLAVCTLLCGVSAAFAQEETATRVLMTFEGGEAIWVLADTATAQDFLSQLPMTLTFLEIGEP